ncbi:MAG: extracellular solute-binding protein [Caldicoprobacterales bacterium]
MKSEMVKKVISILLVIVMFLVITSCGTNDVDKSGKSNVDKAVENDNDQASVNEDNNDSNQPEDKSEPVKLSLFVDEPWWPYDTWKGAIPEEFNRRMNVEIEVTRAADDNQLPLMVSSGDMTDIVCSYRYQFMANEDTSYPLDVLQAEYPEVDFKVHSVLEFVNRAPDGHYYTIGCGFSPNSERKGWIIASEGPGFFYREDIAQELGLSFNSLDDLDTAFAKVKEAKSEMIPIVFNHIHKFGWLRNMMGLPNGGFHDENGSLIWYLQADGQLEFYKKINEWYRSGYITPDNFAFQTEEDTMEIAVAGKAFSVFGYDNHADNYNAALEANNSDFKFKQVTDVISDKAKRYSNFAGGRGLYITKSCENVEAAYKTVAYAYSDEGMKLLMWGIEGEDYTLDDDGYPIFNYNFQGDNTVLEPRGLKYWGWLVHDAIVTGIADANSDTQTAIARNEFSDYTEYNPVIGMIRFETDSEEQVINTKLNEMVSSEEVNILMAETEQACEEAYYAMLEKAESIGLSKLLASANNLYSKLKTEYDKIADNEE